MTLTTHNEYPKRLIEVDLPIARISAHARREKSIRHGHISTLHIWWARRPLAACRAVLCASLWPDPVELTAWAERGEQVPVGDGSVVIRPRRFLDTARERMTAWANRHLGKVSQESYSRCVAIQNGTKTLADPLDLRRALLDFIADFANWDHSTDQDYLATARALTQAAHEALGGEPETRPLVVDPFCGGGSIPLEALRVGADVFASDLNPIPVLLNKVVLEYIPKYGQRLADEVRKWGAWIKQEAEKELAEFYPKDPDGATPIAYLWARTILSESPGQGEVPIEIPLINSFWLSRTRGRKQALRWSRDTNGSVRTQTVEVTYSNHLTRPVRQPILEIFEPKNESEVEGSPLARSSATCPITGYTTPASVVRNQFKLRKGGTNDSRLFCIVKVKPHGTGRYYCLPTPQDIEVAVRASEELQRRVSNHSGKCSLVPDEELPYLRSIFNINLLDVSLWRDLFTSRQLLILTTLVFFVKKAGKEIEKEQGDDFANAIQTCLSLVVGRMADGNSSLTRWQPNRELISNTFGRQALGIVWDFCEANPFCDATRSLSSMFDWIAKVCEHGAAISSSGHAEMASATDHPLPDDSSHLFFTDPPYYDAVPYADLSDFFYVWLKRTVLDLYPSFFNNDLSPKEKEIVQLAERNPKYAFKTRENYEKLMCSALAESRRVLQSSQIGVVVFAHKTTVGWEAQLQAMVDAGWVITGSWPIDTEMGSRLRAMNSAALASSIHLICRPRKNPDGSLQETVGDWRDVLTELPQRIHEWMPRLAEESVVGADAIFACLGPALEIFSRYSRVEKSSGEVVPLREYLEHVWAAVSKEALSMIFKDPDTASLEPDARLTAMWLWTLGASSSASAGEGEEAEDEESDEESGKAAKVSGFTLEFDAARKIAQGLGVHLEKSPSVVEVKGDTAKLLSVSERVKYLFGKDAETAVADKTPRKKKGPIQQSLFAELQAAESAVQTEWGDVKGPKPGTTVLDRLHQAMILFAAGRGEAMKRFIVEEGIGNDARFWKLAQSLSALYPGGSDEKRWVDGVLARKKGLGF